ncbi:ricin B lectin domain-containing protein [Amylostereum chailletii]|nr:ricin B lectin domain-containing protein [Amylostereum chailletii]
MPALIPAKAYILKNVASGTVMDMSWDEDWANANIEKDANVVHGHSYPVRFENQQWYFEERAGGVAIRNKRRNKHLTIKDGIQARALVVAKVVTETPQNFTIWQAAGSDTVQIFVRDTNFCLELNNGDSANRTPISINPHHGGRSQQWTVIPVENE